MHDTKNSTAAKPTARKSRRRLWQLAGAAVVAAAIGAGVWTWVEKSRADAAADAVSRAARSGDYASVGAAVAAGKLKVEDVRQAVGQEFERQTIERVNGYFDTKDPAARRALLDQAIDDLEKFRAESRRRAAATTAPATRPTNLGNDPRLRMAAWALSQPADTRARLAEFRVAFDKRRTERGLPGLFDGNTSLPLGRN